MSNLNTTKTVGQLVAEQPGRARVFEQLGIDYCCGGKRPLPAACADKGLSLDAVVNQLASEDSAPEALAATNWEQCTLTELADHIEATHHTYLKAEMPRIAGLLDKVVAAHGLNHPELPQAREIFQAMHDELLSHMFKEENILFPAIRLIDARGTDPHFHCGSIQNPIRVMEMEHDSAGNTLAQLRELTHDYAVPADACNTYRALLHSLEKLEGDLHQHVHKENNILFPRAIAAETGQPQHQVQNR